MEIHHRQTEPTLTVQQLLEIESCKDYIKTPLQTLDGIVTSAIFRVRMYPHK